MTQNGLHCWLLSMLAAGGSACAKPQPVQAPVARATRMVAQAAPNTGQVQLSRGIDASSAAFAYLDGSGFRKSPFFRALMASASLLPPARQGLAKLGRDCGFDPLERLSELELSARIDDATNEPTDALLALRFDVPESALSSCVRGVALDFTRARIAGHPAWDGGDVWLASEGSTLFVAGRSLLESAFSRRDSQVLEPASGTYLIVSAKTTNPFGLERAELRASALEGDTELALTASTASVTAATTLLHQAEELRRLALTRIERSDQEPALKELSAGLLRKVVFEAEGTRVAARIRMPALEAESAATGLFSALAVYGMNKYIVHAKSAEARSNVLRIGKQVASVVTNEHLPRLPKPAPRTPSQVPRAEAVLVPKSDWAAPAWQTLGFSVEGKQYYAYEFEVAPDGKHGVIRALGDLNGDGVEARFELGVTLQAPGYVVLDSQLREQNPEE